MVILTNQLVCRIVLISGSVCAVADRGDIPVIVIAITVGNGITACGGGVGSDLVAGGFGIGGDKGTIEPTPCPL